MFDLSEQLHRWRRETEATLAFEAEELDELEDHLKLAVEKAIGEGSSPEQAWKNALARLGLASSLAPEYSRNKMLPAFTHLLVSWWRPALLLCFFGSVFYSVMTGGNSFDSFGTSAYLMPLMWGLGFLVMLALLPGKPLKNAVLAGIGNTLCLVPLLHLLVYNVLTEKIIGPSWTRMGASFGWLPAVLGATGLVLFNVWWWKKSRLSGGLSSAMLSVAGGIVLVLGIAPFCGELAGNLLLRELYHLPTADQVHFSGPALTQFNTTVFDALLVDCIYEIPNWLPFIFGLVISAGILWVQWASRKHKAGSFVSEKGVFPSLRDLPWIIVLISSGICWFFLHLVEPHQSEQTREVEKSMSVPLHFHGGIEVVVLFSAAFFFACGYELSRSLGRSTRVRPFYASMVIVAMAVVLAGLIGLPVLDQAARIDYSRPLSQSVEPLGLTLLMDLGIMALCFRLAWLIRNKVRDGNSETSLWKFNGQNLVRFGLQIGLIFACAGLAMWTVAIVMAYDSVALISDPLSYDNAATNTHYPTPHLPYWLFSGVTYLCVCLAVGLLTAIVLSGLEFLRFNGFRYYRMRKAMRELPKALAVNE
jgi:hypothetical protein